VRGSSLCTAYANIHVPSSEYQSNNRYENFPPIMNDGRSSVQASWQPGSVVNNRIMENAGIKSNWQYRQYLSDHAEEIRNQQFTAACTDAGYYDRGFMGPACGASYTPPVLYTSVTEPPRHRGTTSEMKSLYLSKEELQARQVIPSMTQAELVQKFGSHK